MKVLIIFLLLTICVCKAETETIIQEQQVAPPITQPQNITFENCVRMFTISKEKLFYLTLSGITANRFTINEIQTENGYIIFTAAKHKFLATISGIDSNNSILKITPCNNVYFFPPGVYLGLFKYIEMNLDIEIK